ncbi:MAG TPA: molybdenum cofactor biosynthesis protein MoaE [Nitrososphaeraceae archaeon]|jgi:molybdopterin synthase catalytic subunit
MISANDNSVNDKQELYEIQRITGGEISIEDTFKSIQDNSVGATVLFVGTVRNFNEADIVVGMYYESYITMAEERMQIIINDARQKWNIRCKVLHRIGELKVGDISVVVAVSAFHRHDAFDACQYIIERIKREVQIWKKERLSGGDERWVKGYLTEK